MWPLCPQWVTRGYLEDGYKATFLAFKDLRSLFPDDTRIEDIQRRYKGSTDMDTKRGILKAGHVVFHFDSSGKISSINTSYKPSADYE